MPGPSTIQSASSTTSTDSGHAGGSVGDQPDRAHLAGRLGHPGLAADHRRSRRASPGRARSRRPRSPAAPRPSAAPGPRRRAAGRPCPARPPGRRAAPRARRSAGCRWRGRPAVRRSSKRYCSTSAQVRPDSSSPQSAARAIRRSPGRQAVELVPEPAGGTAVVGHRDDRGELVGDPAQRGQRGGQAVAAAEGDHPRAAGPERWRRPAGAAHSRPRSRCSTVVGDPGRSQPAARTPRPSPCCGACRRCSRSRWWRTACPR